MLSMKRSAKLPPVARQKETPPPSSRKQRLEQIRAAIADGTYQVDSAKLSRKIVEKHIKPA